VKWPRMTVRRWMIVAAAIALLLTIGRCMERRAYYLGQVSVNSTMEALYRIGKNGKLEYVSDRHPFVFIFPDMFNKDDTLKAKNERFIQEQHAYFDGLVRKYRYAASYPWTYVELDQPRPRRHEPVGVNKSNLRFLYWLPISDPGRTPPAFDGPGWPPKR
jgi:hypothetical protein